MSSFGLSNMRQSLNRMIEDTLSFASGGSLTIPVDVIETADHVIVLTMPLLGIVPEALDISVSDNTLMIAGETAPQQDPADIHYLRRERRYGRFSRKVSIPVPIQSDQASAELKEGILQITLPKVPQPKPQVIPVITDDDEPPDNDAT